MHMIIFKARLPTHGLRTQMKRTAEFVCPVSTKTRREASGTPRAGPVGRAQSGAERGTEERERKFRKEDSLLLLTQDHALDRADHFHHFYGKDSPFSNFHPAKFVLEGIQYSCSEQYMMYQKAVLFKDMAKAREILGSSDPLTMKRRGRQVKNFDEDVWFKHCVEIVQRGVKAKFQQNLNLEKALIDTFPRVLAEATPRSPLWGIGLGLQDPKINSRKSWQGKNWLGYLLTDVRNEIMMEKGMFLTETDGPRTERQSEISSFSPLPPVELTGPGTERQSEISPPSPN